MKNIKFNKNQLEIISYYLSLDVEEMQGKTKKETINMLTKLQAAGIWGDLPEDK